MRDFCWNMPTQVVFGKEKELEAGRLVRSFGGTRVLVCYGGGSAVRSGLLDRVCGALEAEGLSVLRFGGVQPNPRLEKAREGVRLAVAERIDFLLAVGGGSVIDTAKAIAHGAANPGVDLWEFWSKRQIVEKTLPVGSVLTIPAAGSETSDSAVLTDEAHGRKWGLSSPLNRPRFAILNPALAATLPPYQVACGVSDILMHTLDRYFNACSDNELTDALGEALLRTVLRCGRAAVADPADYHAMSEIMWAGSLSHDGLTGLGNERDFSVHQLGHELSARFDAAHGASLTAVWGAWARRVSPLHETRFAQFAQNVWGLSGGGKSQLAARGAAAMVSYFQELGMPTSLKELGVPGDEATLALLAEGCSRGKTRTVGSLEPISYDEMLEIYRAAW